MKNVLFAAIVAVSAMAVHAQDAVSVNSVSEKPSSTNAVPEKVESERPADESETELEEEETAIFEAGFDFDFYSAYVWRNAVQNDALVMEPAVWADLTYFDPFWLGFYIWQNYDLTDRRGGVYRYGLDETDYNVHLGATVWSSDDEEYELGFELGHDWFTYHGVVSSERSAYPDTREIYVKATFDNPFVNVYGQASWMYDSFGDYKSAMHYEVGFNKEVELVESLTAGVDWNVNFGDWRYLYFLYGGTSRPYLSETDDGEIEVCDDYDGGASGGIGGTTVKLYLTWQVTEWFSIGGTVAYTGLLNGPLRESIGDQGDDYDFYCGGRDYPRDLVWGGLNMKLSF